MAVGSRGDSHLIGVLRRRRNQGQRVPVGVGEAFQRIGSVGSPLFDVDFRGNIGLLRGPVLAVGEVQGHVRAGGLAASVRNLIAERHFTRPCGRGIKLQVPSVINGEDRDIRTVGRADRIDVQHRAVGLLIVTQHVEDLLRSGTRTERIVLRPDLP